MMLSLRARLTLWYSALLTIALVVFTTVVLWAQWQLLLRQTDEVLAGLSSTAGNVFAEEIGEKLAPAAAAKEAEEMVRAPGRVISVYDAAARPLMRVPPLLGHLDGRPAGVGAVETVYGPDGTPWRIALRTARVDGLPYTIAAGVSQEDALRQWRSLRRASLVGLALVLVLAGIGGSLLGRHGLRPLSAMALQARAMTPETVESRLDVPRTGDELADVGESFNRVLERLQNALDDQRRFMADASHELRTPVSTIRTAVDVTLSRATREPDEYRDALETVAQQSSQLARLVDDMLVLARAGAGGYRTEFTDIDLGDLAADCIRDVSPLASARRITVSSEIRRGTFVRGDDGLLRRLLLNLLTNAILYTPEGGRAAVTCDLQGPTCELHVTDSGPGIPRDDQERIFGRFVRLNPARSPGGSGLGLAIGRWIAEAHGGTLHVARSGPGGTTFTARLPCNEDAAV